jgi:hypothetical protein
MIGGMLRPASSKPDPFPSELVKAGRPILGLCAYLASLAARVTVCAVLAYSGAVAAPATTTAIAKAIKG